MESSRDNHNLHNVVRKQQEIVPLGLLKGPKGPKHKIFRLILFEGGRLMQTALDILQRSTMFISKFLLILFFGNQRIGKFLWYRQKIGLRCLYRCLPDPFKSRIYENWQIQIPAIAMEDIRLSIFARLLVDHPSLVIYNFYWIIH